MKDIMATLKVVMTILWLIMAIIILAISITRTTTELSVAFWACLIIANVWEANL